jgi:lysophospholipase L1-like esterase
VRHPLVTSLATLGVAVLLAAGLWAAATPSSTPASEPQQVLVVGDSLAVGLKPFLGVLLAPREVTWDAVSGRTTPQGMLALRAALRRLQPDVVVLSLGTNDGPDPRRFASRIQRTMHAIPQDACVVWSLIYRPPRKGPYDALNHVLRLFAERDPRLFPVDWRRAVSTGAVALPDGLHPDPAGFRYRSRMLAAAVRRGCR